MYVHNYVRTYVRTYAEAEEVQIYSLTFLNVHVIRACRQQAENLLRTCVLHLIYDIM